MVTSHVSGTQLLFGDFCCHRTVYDECLSGYLLGTVAKPCVGLVTSSHSTRPKRTNSHHGSAVSGERGQTPSRVNNNRIPLEVNATENHEVANDAPSLINARFQAQQASAANSPGTEGAVNDVAGTSHNGCRVVRAGSPVRVSAVRAGTRTNQDCNG